MPYMYDLPFDAEQFMKYLFENSIYKMDSPKNTIIMKTILYI